MTAPALTLWACLAVCLYVYFGYPLLVMLLGTLHQRPVRAGDVTPGVSVIIAAHNEAPIIAEKLENMLGADYPAGRMEILVASDGSTDATEAIVRRFASRGVRLLALPRCGKLQALNQAAAQARNEVLVFTDANAFFAPDALRHLVRSFADPEVGGVCGNKQYWWTNTGNGTSEGESLYWTYDKRLKDWESRLGSIVAADGAIYAIRARLFVPMTELAQADDFAISARVVVQGFRLVFDPEAIAYERTRTSSGPEFWRKVRVTNHSMRGILNVHDALKPWRYGWYAIELLSHKVLRHLVPWFLLIALASNAALARGSRVYQVLLAGQLLFYGSAAIGYALRRSPWGRQKPFYAPLYFCLANAAAFIGVLSLFRGTRIATWQPQR